MKINKITERELMLTLSNIIGIEKQNLRKQVSHLLSREETFNTLVKKDLEGYLECTLVLLPNYLVTCKQKNKFSIYEYKGYLNGVRKNS
jgi:hypothetical protein